MSVSAPSHQMDPLSPLISVLIANIHLKYALPMQLKDSQLHRLTSVNISFIH